jgi:beta-N-acetylhexosaminidase
VVVTDDLVMGAIYQNDVCGAVVEALNAGVDLLLVAYDGAQFYRIFACATAAAGKGRLDPAMLEQSEIRLRRLRAMPASSLDRATSGDRLHPSG